MAYAGRLVLAALTGVPVRRGLLVPAARRPPAVLFADGLAVMPLVIVVAHVLTAWLTPAPQSSPQGDAAGPQPGQPSPGLPDQRAQELR